LLFLNRLDLVILLGPTVAYLLIQARGADRAKVILAAAMPALVWSIFSIIYYGAPLPNTAYAKLGTGFSTLTLILRGLEYCKDFVLTDPLLVLIISKVAFDTLRSRDWTTGLLGCGIVFYIAYIIVIGGDFMSGRFFASPGFLAVCLLVRTPVPQWLTQQVRLMVLIAAVAILAVLLVIRTMEQPDFTAPANGIADEKRFYYSDNGFLPVLKKWVRTGSEPVHPWGQWGREFKSRAQIVGRPIVVVEGEEGNAGMPGYYAGQTVHILDSMALTDAFLARLPAIPGARVGHYKRMLPLGYAETVLKAAPSTGVEALRPLLNDVTLVTRAPLFSEGRWDAIWRLLSGRYHWVYETDIVSVNK
jgi:arabinofuranosyltransferase